MPEIIHNVTSFFLVFVCSTSEECKASTCSNTLEAYNKALLHSLRKLITIFSKIDAHIEVLASASKLIGSLRKPRQQQQREHHQTKFLMSRTMAVDVRYNSLCISLPSSAKLQHEMINSALSGERELQRLIFWNSISNLLRYPRFSFVITLTVIKQMI